MLSCQCCGHSRVVPSTQVKTLSVKWQQPAKLCQWSVLSRGQAILLCCWKASLGFEQRRWWRRCPCPPTFLLGFSSSEAFPLLSALEFVVYPLSRPLVVSLSSFLLPLQASLATAMEKVKYKVHMNWSHNHQTSNNHFLQEVVLPIHSGKTQSALET